MRAMAVGWAAGRGERRARGVSFVEVLVTAIIIGLLAAIAIPSFMATRGHAQEAAAVSLLRAGASAVEAAAVGTDGYAVLTPAGVSAVEGTVRWTAAPGARADRDEVSLSGVGPHGYTLTTTAASGTVYVFEKDLRATPTVTRSCGPGCAW